MFIPSKVGGWQVIEEGRHRLRIFLRKLAGVHLSERVNLGGKWENKKLRTVPCVDFIDTTYRFLEVLQLLSYLCLHVTQERLKGG